MPSPAPLGPMPGVPGRKRTGAWEEPAYMRCGLHQAPGALEPRWRRGREGEGEGAVVERGGVAMRRGTFCDVPLARDGVPGGTVDRLARELGLPGQLEGNRCLENPNLHDLHMLLIPHVDRATFDRIPLGDAARWPSEFHPPDKLDFSGVKVRGFDMGSLCYYVRQSWELREITLVGSYVWDAGAFALALALRGNPTLVTLNLRRNGISALGAEALGVALSENRVLRRLGLASNEIGCGGAAALALGLETNKGLEKLWLYDNDIGDEGAVALAAALKKNAVLEELYLHDNRIGERGARALADALHQTGFVDAPQRRVYNRFGEWVNRPHVYGCTLRKITLRGNHISVPTQEALIRHLRRLGIATDLGE